MNKDFGTPPSGATYGGDTEDGLTGWLKQRDYAMYRRSPGFSSMQVFCLGLSLVLCLRGIAGYAGGGFLFCAG
jgi:hypothetical protein